jgi:hypothetical protein
MLDGIRLPQPGIWQYSAVWARVLAERDRGARRYHDADVSCMSMCEYTLDRRSGSAFEAPWLARATVCAHNDSLTEAKPREKFDVVIVFPPKRGTRLRLRPLAVPFFSVSIPSGYSPHGPDFGVYAFTLHTRARPSERLGKALRLHRPRAVARHARQRLPTSSSSHPPTEKHRSRREQRSVAGRANGQEGIGAVPVGQVAALR